MRGHGLIVALSLCVVLSFGVATAAAAVEPGEVVVVERPVAEGQERYVVVLVRGASSKQVAETTRALSGIVEADLATRLVITLSPNKVEELRRNAAVKYLQRAVLGSATTEDNTDDDMQPRTMSVPSLPAVQPHVGQTWTTGVYSYDGAGNISGIGTSPAAGTQGYRTYAYDKVNRLTKATLAGISPASTHEYSYDVYGNRTSYGLNEQWTTVPLTSPTNNRLSDATYDSSGNQTARGATAAVYDGFNMVTEYEFDGTNSEQFVYTANDERIGVLRGTEWTWSLRDAGGKVLRQYRSSSTNTTASWLWVEDFVYRNGLLLGAERVAEEGGRRHFHLDHLGSARLVTGATGSIISEHDFLPFGEERTVINQHQLRGYDREEPQRYTGHERDFDNTTPNGSSSYIDYMHARYYGATSGRFLSVDPMLGDEQRPQSWNRYTYVENNPVNATDPTGMLTVWGRRPVDPIIAQLDLWFWQVAWSGAQQRARIASAAFHSYYQQWMGIAGTAGRVMDPDCGDDDDCADLMFSMSGAGVYGGRIGRVALALRGAVNLPAWRKVTINMAHIMGRHTPGGSATSPGASKFVGMSEKQIERAIREAYRGGKRISTQGDRVKLIGRSGSLTIEMYVNVATKVIETAYPVFGR